MYTKETRDTEDGKETARVMKGVGIASGIATGWKAGVRFSAG
jgi:hypothetical protein